MPRSVLPRCGCVISCNAKAGGGMLMKGQAPLLVVQDYYAELLDCAPALDARCRWYDGTPSAGALFSMRLQDNTKATQRKDTPNPQV